MHEAARGCRDGGVLMISTEAMQGDLAAQLAEPRRRQGPRRSAGFIVALTILVIIIVVALAASVVAPYNPLSQNLNRISQGPSRSYLLGTTAVGQDVLSRLIWGARPALEGVIIGLAVMLVLGVPWGLAAGYLGRWSDEVLMRLADAFLAFPGIVLAIAITAVLGPSLTNAMVSVGVVFAPSVARLLRSAVLPLRQADFVRLPALFGVSRTRIAWRHVLPNAMAPVLVQACTVASVMLIIEAALGFLGLGTSVSSPSWGADLANAYSNFVSDPLATVAPGLVIAVTAMCLSRVGDGLRAKLGVG
jgi:peptide/nickel transport system permease protein